MGQTYTVHKTHQIAGRSYYYYYCYLVKVTEEKVGRCEKHSTPIGEKTGGSRTGRRQSRGATANAER